MHSKVVLDLTNVNRRISFGRRRYSRIEIGAFFTTDPIPIHWPQCTIPRASSSEPKNRAISCNQACSAHSREETERSQVCNNLYNWLELSHKLDSTIYLKHISIRPRRQTTEDQEQIRTMIDQFFHHSTWVPNSACLSEKRAIESTFSALQTYKGRVTPYLHELLAPCMINPYHHSK